MRLPDFINQTAQCCIPPIYRICNEFAYSAKLCFWGRGIKAKLFGISRFCLLVLGGLACATAEGTLGFIIGVSLCAAIPMFTPATALPLVGMIIGFSIGLFIGLDTMTTFNKRYFSVQDDFSGPVIKPLDGFDLFSFIGFQEKMYTRSLLSSLQTEKTQLYHGSEEKIEIKP